jgi:serine/threonine protein kinase/tetratricopeptide (TPR) repeat protein
MPAYDSARLYELYLSAVELAADTQQAFLLNECGDDRSLREAVEALLAADKITSKIWLEPRPGGLPAGSLIGPYRIVDMIGRGGMGAVYSARRADGHDDQLVAVKLISAGMFSTELRSRFLRERQVLAGLDHPAIARLLDAGITAESQPYLVLEYVDGIQIDRYADQRGLGIRERLHLFLQVCAALEEAHRKLVVHRDIKPANILVTKSGQPKLLDFGIAKILTAGDLDQDNSARTALLFTPNYASPEQVGGKAIGVGTDVYSLGVLLYQLLSGTLPLPIDTASPLEAARMVQEVDPRPPSAASDIPERRAALRGDLDTMILYALRKDPAQRYPSVESFAADIARYLDGFPVHARGNSFRYRLAKFTRRNRVWVVFIAVLLIVIAGSMAAVVRSAQIARSQRAIAERRFAELHELANSYIYELDKELEMIPGTTKVRSLMAKRSIQYLDRLTAESGDDIKLQRDAANGYMTLAMVQSMPGYANLGDRKGARDNMQKAVRLRRTLLAANGDKVEDHLMFAYTLTMQGGLNLISGDLAAAAAAHKQALAETDWVLAKTPNPTGRQLFVAQGAAGGLALDLAGSGAAPHLGDPVAALPLMERARELCQQEGEVRARLPAGQSNNDYRYSNLTVTENNLARLHWLGLEQPEKAREHFQRAFEFLHKPGVNLDNEQIRAKLTALNTDYGMFLLDRGQLAAAIPYLREGYAGSHKAALQDPRNQNARLIDAFAELMLGRDEAVTGKLDGGFARINHGLQELRELSTLDPADALRANIVFYGLFFAGNTALSCGRNSEATAWLTEGSTRARAAANAHPSDAFSHIYLSRAEHGLARCFIAQSQPEQAREHDARAAAAIKPVLDAHPGNPQARRILAEATGK